MYYKLKNTNFLYSDIIAVKSAIHWYKVQHSVLKSAVIPVGLLMQQQLCVYTVYCWRWEHLFVPVLRVKGLYHGSTSFKIHLLQLP